MVINTHGRESIRIRHGGLDYVEAWMLDRNLAIDNRLKRDGGGVEVILRRQDWLEVAANVHDHPFRVPR